MASEESSDDCQNGLIDNPKIVIIGAGISGIAAGSYLASSGFTDFVILEATERIGGRIHSIDLGEFSILKIICSKVLASQMTNKYAKINQLLHPITTQYTVFIL